MMIPHTLLAALISLSKVIFSFTCFKVLALCISLASNIATANNQDVELTLCYENKEFPPHFFGNSTLIPTKNPGVVVDTLRELDKEEVGISIKFVRKPWARCLKDLASGRISAVVASYSIEREKYAVYPRSQNKVDHSRAFSLLATCLLHPTAEQISWDGYTLTLESPTTIAVPRGYKIIPSLKKIGFTVYITDSIEQAHKLLFFHRVSASISDCRITDYPLTITMNKTPLRSHYGHLILSNSFYQQHKQLSERLWDRLKQIDKQKYYQHYLKAPITARDLPNL